MAKAVILHTIEDVQHCLKHGLHKDARLFSANVNVVYYLRYKCGLECEDLCSYVTIEDFLNIRESAFQASQLLFNELDQQIAMDLNQCLELNIRYFVPLYSFVGSRQLCCYAILTQCFNRMLKQYSFEDILIYEGTLGPLNSSIKSFLLQAFPSVPWLILHKDDSYEKLQTIIHGIALHEIPELVLQKDRSSLNIDISKKSSIVFEPFDRLSLSLESFVERNILTFDPSAAEMDNMQQYQLSYSVLPLINSLSNMQLGHGEMKKPLLLLYEDIRKDFCRNIIQYLWLLHYYRILHEKANIEIAYWETPFYQGAGALLLEYLMTNKVTKVIGVQASPTFWAGKLIVPHANEVIFSRCHTYLTLGVTKTEIDTLYPEHLREVSIISPGVAFEEDIQPALTSGAKSSIDMAIYITPTSSFLQTGHISTHITKQKSILSSLELRQDKHIHVVIHESATYANCPMLSVIRKLKNVTLITEACLDTYLAKYAPGLLLVDAFLPDWEKILEEDISIILMQDDMAPFGDIALPLLQKRVYYVKEAQDAKQLLQMYFEGKLPTKRDVAYRARYVNHAGLKKQVSQLNDPML